MTLNLVELYCHALSLTRYRGSVSLRFGHARVLTPHCGVIHSAHAASLPPRGSLIKCLLQWEKAFLVCLMIEVFSPYFYFLVYKYIFVWYNKFATQI